MFIDSWTDKEAVVHIYTGILLSHKKEHIWVSSNEVVEPRAYYTEWSKSEREKLRSHTNAYIWNLERWYWWTYLQGSNRDTDIENRLDTVGEAEGGMNWENNGNIDINVYKIDSKWEFAVWHRELNPVLWDSLEGWRGVQEEGNMCTPVADSCWFVAETSTIL